MVDGGPSSGMRKYEASILRVYIWLTFLILLSTRRLQVREAPKRNFVIVLLFSWILFGLIGSFFSEPVQEPPKFVTETSDYIKIENSYFIANITKGWHGHISEFYIKPQTSVNIVALPQWNFIGGHETVMSWNGTEKASMDWGLENYKQSQTTEIVYQTNSVIVTESKTTFKGAFLNFSVTEYIAFYKDKPYYLATTSRTYNEETKHQFNNQYCILFNDAWGDTCCRVNHNNTIEKITADFEGDSVGIWEAQYLEKYPWIMMFNTTYNRGHFSILLSANPHHTSLGMLGTDPGNFREYQVHYAVDSAKVGDSWTVTLLSGVAENTTYVDTLATSLWSNDVIQADSDNIYRVASNPKIESDNRKSRITNQLGTYWTFHNALIRFGQNSGSYNRIFLGNEDNPHGEWWLYYLYENSTGYYSMWGNVADMSVNQSTYSWNEGFTNTTVNHTFEDKWDIGLRIETWNNSDSFYLTYKFTLLKNANLTYLQAFFKINEPQAQFDIVSLNASVWKVNMSSYYINNMYDDGVIFQNVSGNCDKIEAERQASCSFFHFYLRYNRIQETFSSGTSWTLKILVQPYRRYTSQGLGYFGLNDIKLPEKRQSETMTYHHRLSWNKIPLDDTIQPFRINHYGKNFLVSEANATSHKLTLKVVGESVTPNNIKVYCGPKGEPRSVSGATSWSYDRETRILTATIKVTHSSGQLVEVQWWKSSKIIPPHVYFHLWQQNTYINFAATRSLNNIIQTKDKIYFDQYWFSVENANLTVLKFFTSYQLIFAINAPSQSISITKVYVDEWGEPTSVYASSGTLTWSYDQSVKMLTFTATHSSRVEISVDWRITGDIDRDGDVDYDDFVILAGAYGSRRGQPAYEPEADFDIDGDVDYDDFIALAGNYGKILDAKSVIPHAFIIITYVATVMGKAIVSQSHQQKAKLDRFKEFEKSVDHGVKKL